MSKNLIGRISANINGDYRYTIRIEVWDAGETVTITRSENGAIGGIAGPGGASPFAPTLQCVAARDPKAILAATTRAFDDTVKRYGKLTKRFEWWTGDDRLGITGGWERGLSVKLVQRSLDTFQPDDE